MHTDLTISALQANQGAKVEINTIRGKRTVNIQAGAWEGKVYELVGCGIQHQYPQQHLRGDHMVHVKISDRAKGSLWPKTFKNAVGAKPSSI